MKFILLLLFFFNLLYTKEYEGVKPIKLREKPSLSSDIIGFLDKGEKIEVLDFKDGWAKTDRGRVKEKYLKMIDTPSIQEIEECLVMDTKPDEFIEEKIVKKDMIFEDGEGFDVNISTQKNPTALKNVIYIALDTNYAAKESKERISQYIYRTRESRAGALPYLSLTTSGDRTRKYSESDDVEQYSGYSATIKATQNLYDWGVNKHNQKMYIFQTEENRFKHQGVLENEIIKVAEAYMGVVYESKALEILQENMGILQKILDIVSIKSKEGAATQAEESSIRANVADANKTLVKQESKYIDAVSYYEFITNISTEEAFPYQNHFDIFTESFDESFEKIKSRNSGVMATKEAVNSKSEELKSVSAEKRPRLDLIGSHTNSETWNGGDGRVQDSSMKLQITKDLYDGGENESKKKRIYSEISELEYKMERQLKELKWDAKKLYNSVKTLDDALANSKTQLDATEDMVNSYWEKFQLSSQDLNILLTAQRSLYETKIDRLAYKKNQIIDYFKLLAMKGELLEYFEVFADVEK